MVDIGIGPTIVAEDGTQSVGMPGERFVEDREE